MASGGTLGTTEEKKKDWGRRTMRLWFLTWIVISNLDCDYPVSLAKEVPGSAASRGANFSILHLIDKKRGRVAGSDDWMLEVGKTRHLLLGTKVENHQARKATSALKGNTHSKKVGAGWGDEGSAIHEDRRMRISRVMIWEWDSNGDREKNVS